ncbi:uncharacterized protein uimc1 isoform X2 [Brachyhypopomus gauderio]
MSRAARYRERGNKVQIQDMTEDEMLDLAMRLSKQEANTAAQRQQLEDDDMRKAIAESLHDSQDQDGDSQPISPTPNPRRDPHTVTCPLRRKLSFPNKNETHSAGSADTADGTGSGVDSTQEDSPLPLMSDLSQRTTSQPPSLCPALPSVPSTSSQERPSSQWKDELLDADSPEREPSQRDSPLQGSSAFLRRSSAHLGQGMTRASGKPPRTRHRSPDLSQLDSLPLGSPIFSKADPKRGAGLSSDNDDDNFTDNVCSPNKEENFQKISSHKNLLHESRDCQKRLSLCSTAQPLNRFTVPDGKDDDGDVDIKQTALKPDRTKHESTRGRGFTSVPERTTNSEETLLPVQTKSFQEFTSHMVLHLSDDDDEVDEEEERVVVPSPVFHQESVLHARPPRLSPTQPCCSLLATATSTHTRGHSSHQSNSQDVLQQNIPKTTDPSDLDHPEASRARGVRDTPALDSRFTEGKGEGLVSYYWGVPFCPRGQNPDDYTRVIQSQLEVYEKSLKAAQRGLLRKMDWGQPVFPCSAERSFGRRLKRHRAPRLLDEEDDDEEHEKQQQQRQEEQKAERAGEERAGSRAGSDGGEGDGQSEPYVVVSSPEAQEELTHKSLLFGQKEAMDTFKPSSPQDGSPVRCPDECEGQYKQCDLESSVCPETQMTEDSTPELMMTSPVQPQSHADNEVMEVDEEGNPPAPDEERMEQEQSEEDQQGDPPPDPTVACPMCCRLFAREKIEMHAAYCDGTPEQHEPRVQARLKRTGRMVTGKASPRPERSEELEKCYLCLKFFSREEYTQHVPQCIQQKTTTPNQGNGLLAALDQTEKRHIDNGAGPSDIKSQDDRGLADSSVVAEAGGGRSSLAANLHISSSPIKSFTPISEATDCLIDFKHQYSARPSQRLGRKRKFKR